MRIIAYPLKEDDGLLVEFRTRQTKLRCMMFVCQQRNGKTGFETNNGAMPRVDRLLSECCLLSHKFKEFAFLNSPTITDVCSQFDPYAITVLCPDKELVESFGNLSKELKVRKLNLLKQRYGRPVAKSSIVKLESLLKSVDSWLPEDVSLLLDHSCAVVLWSGGSLYGLHFYTCCRDAKWPELQRRLSSVFVGHAVSFVDRLEEVPCW